MKWWLGTLGALAVAAAIGWGSASSPTADGYILFSPPTGASPLLPVGENDVRLDECEVTFEGLRVRGHVSIEQPPVQILVTPAAPPGAGVRVGASLAAQVPQFAGAVQGDFEVVIPWATPDSRFLVVSAPAAGVVGSQDIAADAQRLGTTCPE